jgi:hypothetical protein
MKMYEVVKFTQKGRQTVIRTGLTEQEAQKICSDPETSSMTAKGPRGCENNEKKIATWHKNNQHWFYGYRSYDG